MHRFDGRHSGSQVLGGKPTPVSQLTGAALSDDWTVLQALGHVTEVAVAATSEDVHMLLLAAVLAEVLLPAVELAHLKPSQRGALRNAIAAAAPGMLDLTMRCLPHPLLVRRLGSYPGVMRWVC